MQLRKEFSLCRIYKKSAKRLRAFGRRPSAERDESGARQVHSEEANAIAIQESPPTVDIRSSPKSSSFSRDNDGYLSQPAGDRSNLAMAISNEPLWDWDHLYQCYYNGEDVHLLK